jgi:NAD(P)-dependent dehydrogenase (short-subunit alcohol dehydrogenase family)
MRAAKSGVIANMGSIAGWYGGPALGYYCATKAALVGITEAVRAEVAPLGIKAVIIEPGYFRTNFLTSGAKITAKKVIEDYKAILDPAKDSLKNYNLRQPGDVVKGAAVIIEALTGTGRAEGKTLPARLPLGRDCVAMIGGLTERHLKELEEWSDLASTTDHEDVV